MTHFGSSKTNGRREIVTFPVILVPIDNSYKLGHCGVSLILILVRVFLRIIIFFEVCMFDTKFE